MPACHVFGVSPQICSRFEVMVVELQVKMMSLKVSENKDTRDSTGEFAETVVNVLRHQRNTLLKLLTVDLRTATYSGTLAPRSRRIGVEWPARPKLALGESLHSSTHVGVVRWAVTLGLLYDIAEQALTR